MESLKEIDIIYNIIINPAGFDVGCSGLISIRRYEYPMWAVEWQKELDSNVNFGIDVLEFEDPRLAAECFVELRHICNIGLDKENDSLSCIDLKSFKEKYKK